MNRKFAIAALALSSLTCFLSCEKAAKEPERVETAPKIGSFDAEKTLERIKKINSAPDYALFQSEWKDLHSVLSVATKNGDINQLSEDQRSELWWAIEYMRACAHPEIFHRHNQEIIPLLFAIDLPEMNQQLREILIADGQIKDGEK